MAKKAKAKSTAATYDNDDDDSEDEFEEDTTATEATTANALSEGADAEPQWSAEQAAHYLRNIGHWHQFITTLKQNEAAKIEQDKLTEYKFALKGEKPPANP